MTDEEAIKCLRAIELTTGWKLKVITRQDVARRWYPEAENPQITEEQWMAFRQTKEWKNTDFTADLWDELTEWVDDAIFEAKIYLENRRMDADL